MNHSLFFALVNIGFDPFHVSLYQPRNTDFRTEGNSLTDNLTVIAVALVAHVLQLRLKIAGAVTGRVISEHIQRSFASMESSFAQLCTILHSLNSWHELIATAFNVFVGSFVNLHFALLTISMRHRRASC